MLITENELKRGAQLVARCEVDLGRLLSRGESVDLICDNTPDDEEQWSLEKCQEIAAGLFGGSAIGVFHMIEARIAAPSWGSTIKSKVKPKTLMDAVIASCGGLYRIKRLGPDAIVRGQAMTYLQQSLRLDGWRAVTYSNLTHLAENSSGRLAFARGRGRRVYHGGNMGWGGECDVFYRPDTLSQATDTQLKQQDSDEHGNHYF